MSMPVQPQAQNSTALPTGLPTGLPPALDPFNTSPAISNEEVEEAVAGLLITSGLVDFNQYLERISRGERRETAINDAFLSGRVKGDFRRFVQDWKRLPQTTADFIKLVAEHPGKLPGMLAEGMKQAAVELPHTLKEQPIQGLSDLLLFLSLGVSGAGAVGVAARGLQTASIASRIGRVGTAALKTQTRLEKLLGAAAIPGEIATRAVPPKALTIIGAASDVTDPNDPLGLALSIGSPFVQMLNRTRLDKIERRQKGLEPKPPEPIKIGPPVHQPPVEGTPGQAGLDSPPTPRATATQIGQLQQARQAANEIATLWENSGQAGSELLVQRAIEDIVRPANEFIERAKNNQLSAELATDVIDTLNKAIDALRQGNQPETAFPGVPIPKTPDPTTPSTTAISFDDLLERIANDNPQFGQQIDLTPEEFNLLTTTIPPAGQLDTSRFTNIRPIDNFTVFTRITPTPDGRTLFLTLIDDPDAGRPYARADDIFDEAETARAFDEPATPPPELGPEPEPETRPEDGLQAINPAELANRFYGLKDGDQIALTRNEIDVADDHKIVNVANQRETDAALSVRPEIRESGADVIAFTPDNRIMFFSDSPDGNGNTTLTLRHTFNEIDTQRFYYQLNQTEVEPEIPLLTRFARRERFDIFESEPQPPSELTRTSSGREPTRPRVGSAIGGEPAGPMIPDPLVQTNLPLSGTPDPSAPGLRISEQELADIQNTTQLLANQFPAFRNVPRVTQLGVIDAVVKANPIMVRASNGQLRSTDQDILIQLMGDVSQSLYELGKTDPSVLQLKTDLMEIIGKPFGMKPHPTKVGDTYDGNLHEIRGTRPGESGKLIDILNDGIIDGSGKTIVKPNVIVGEDAGRGRPGEPDPTPQPPPDPEADLPEVDPNTLPDRPEPNTIAETDMPDATQIQLKIPKSGEHADLIKREFGSWRSRPSVIDWDDVPSMLGVTQQELIDGLPETMRVQVQSVIDEEIRKPIDTTLILQRWPGNRLAIFKTRPRITRSPTIPISNLGVVDMVDIKTLTIQRPPTSATETITSREVNARKSDADERFPSSFDSKAGQTFFRPIHKVGTTKRGETVYFGYNELDIKAVYASITKDGKSKPIYDEYYGFEGRTSKEKKNMVRGHMEMLDGLRDTYPDGPFTDAATPVVSTDSVNRTAHETANRVLQMLGLDKALRVFAIAAEDVNKPDFHARYKIYNNSNANFGSFTAVDTATAMNRGDGPVAQAISTLEQQTVIPTAIVIFDEAKIQNNFDEINQKLKLTGTAKDTAFSQYYTSLMVHEIMHTIDHNILQQNAEFNAIRELLETDYRAWVLNNMGDIRIDDFLAETAMLYHAAFPEIRVGPLTSKTIDQLGAYATSFSEYLAEQASRWILTSQKPKNILERIFKGIADVNRRVIQLIAKDRIKASPTGGFFDVLTGEHDTVAANLFKKLANGYVEAKGRRLSLGVKTGDELIERMLERQAVLKQMRPPSVEETKRLQAVRGLEVNAYQTVGPNVVTNDIKDLKRTVAMKTGNLGVINSDITASTKKFLNSALHVASSAKALASKWGESGKELIRTIEFHINAPATNHTLHWIKMFEPWYKTHKNEIKRLAQAENISIEEATVRLNESITVGAIEKGDAPLPGFENHTNEFVIVWNELIKTVDAMVTALNDRLDRKGLTPFRVFDEDTGKALTWEEAKLHAATQTFGEAKAKAMSKEQLLEAFAKRYFPRFSDANRSERSFKEADNINHRAQIMAQLAKVLNVEEIKFGPLEFTRNTKDFSYITDPIESSRRFIEGFFRRYFEILAYGQTNEFLNSVLLRNVHNHSSSIEEEAIKMLREALIGERIETYPDTQTARLPEFTQYATTSTRRLYTERGILDAMGAWQGADIELNRIRTFTDARFGGDAVIKLLSDEKLITVDPKTNRAIINHTIDANGDVRVPAVAEIIKWQSFADERLLKAKEIVTTMANWNRVDPNVSQTQGFWRILNSATTISLMGPISTLFNLTELGLLPMKTGARNTFKALVNYITTPEWRETGKVIGATWDTWRQHMSDGIPLTNLYLQATGFQWVENTLRSIGGVAGFHAARESIDNYLTAKSRASDAGIDLDTNKPRALRNAEARLKELRISSENIDRIIGKYNLSRQDVLDRIDASRDNIINGAAMVTSPQQIRERGGKVEGVVAEGLGDDIVYMTEGLDEAELALGELMSRSSSLTSQDIFKQYNRLSLPPHLTDRHPVMKNLLKFKSWILQQNSLMYGSVKYMTKEAIVHGNVAPLRRWLGAMTALGLGGMAASSVAAFGTGNENRAANFIKGISILGGFGLLGEFANIALSVGGNPLLAEASLLSFIGGPLAGRAADLGSGVLQALPEPLGGGDARLLSQELVRGLPFAGAFRERIAPDLFAESQEPIAPSTRRETNRSTGR